MRKGLEYEENVKKKKLNGGTIGQETRRFDESTGKTILMRVKEGSDDYRYSQNQILYLYMSMMSGKNVRQTIPELPRRT